MDLVNTWGLKNPSNMDDDVITQVFNEAVEEANKSMEYLKHIGE
jgi:agmatine/peptidylarginine deiminase